MIFVFILIFELLLAAILFGGAGRIDLPWYWALIGAHATLVTIGAAFIDPDLLRERRRPNNPGIDQGLRMALSIAILVHLAIAALDVRFGWTNPAPAMPARAAAL